MTRLNDKVSEILRGFEEVYLSKEEIFFINRGVEEEMKKSYYKNNKARMKSEEDARKIYITC